MNKINMLARQNASQMLDSFFAQGASILYTRCIPIKCSQIDEEYRINTFRHGTSRGKGERVGVREEELGWGRRGRMRRGG